MAGATRQIFLGNHAEIGRIINQARKNADACGMIKPSSKCSLCHDSGYITHGYIGHDGFVYRGISRCHRSREKCGRSGDRPGWNCETCGSVIVENPQNIRSSRCSNEDCKHSGWHNIRQRIPKYDEVFICPAEEFMGELLYYHVGWKLVEGKLYPPKGIEKEPVDLETMVEKIKGNIPT